MIYSFQKNFIRNFDYSSFYRSYVRILGHPPGADRGVLAKPNDNVIGNVTVQI